MILLKQDVQKEQATEKAWHDDREQKAGRVHGVTIAKNSILYRFLQCETVRVNSMHHQAIRTVADSFFVTAMSEDGLIEGIEYNGDWFCIGVQWHPEHMAVTCPEQRLLFEGFLKQCKISLTGCMNNDIL